MMKTTNVLKKGACKTQTPFSLVIKTLLISILVLTSIQLPLQAQDTYTRPSWWFGVAGGANLNYYLGTTQELNDDLFLPAAFHHGKGIGLYLAPSLEFHRPDSRWGFILQAGYDSRKGAWEEASLPCVDCPINLETKLSYITIEPSLRLAPFKGNFYLFAGPRLAFNYDKSFTYSQGMNPNFPNERPPEDINADFSEVNNMIISMQVGAGLDIPLSSQSKRTQWMISPFVSFHPYYGQDPRSIQTWTMTTLRVGAVIKFGRGSEIKETVKETVRELVKETVKEPVKEVKPIPIVVVAETDVKFSVISPENIPVKRRVRETFPILNYVFFDVGSNKISERYVLITKDQVKDFKEDRLEVFTPKHLSGRSAREMVVYYNVLNILGDRMNQYPNVKVSLIGATLEGISDGKAMAEAVKSYLVSVFGINPTRITTEGKLKPKLPSEEIGRKDELKLLREEDNRVTIWSESPEILMEYETGPNVPLKPVDVIVDHTAPLDSYVTFIVEGAEKALSSWSLELTDNRGKVQKYGPSTGDSRSIPGKTILGDLTDGVYKVKMIGQTKDGKTIEREASFSMRLWTPSVDEQAMRYSVIYEFDEPKVTRTYIKYLTEVVTPKIPKGANVILSGYTDVIGDAANNKRLSLARANDVKSIIEKALAKAGRTDVTFTIYGFGQDNDLSPFDNKYPEERFYNRTVIIDIIPK
jgi:outer membrane protein OmpA-like peptidoglycan-associated protein